MLSAHEAGEAGGTGTRWQRVFAEHQLGGGAHHPAHGGIGSKLREPGSARGHGRHEDLDSGRVSVGP